MEKKLNKKGKGFVLIYNEAYQNCCWTDWFSTLEQAEEKANDLQGRDNIAINGIMEVSSYYCYD